MRLESIKVINPSEPAPNAVRIAFTAAYSSHKEILDRLRTNQRARNAPPPPKTSTEISFRHNYIGTLLSNE
jgi:hypothetical protein